MRGGRPPAESQSWSGLLHARIKLTEPDHNSARKFNTRRRIVSYSQPQA
jgi:hypothetical protein